MRLWCWWSFNSLSRDHRSRTGFPITRRWSSPFNSLSRDHGPENVMFIDVELDDSHFQLPLSGSRSLRDQVSQRACLGLPFNSLSRDHARDTRELFDHLDHFQLPLSGSHHIRHPAPTSAGRPPLSTPSLGITLRNFPQTFFAPHTFNSLSRDHRARFRDFPALRGFLPRRPFAQMISKATI